MYFLFLFFFSSFFVFVLLVCGCFELVVLLSCVLLFRFFCEFICGAKDLQFIPITRPPARHDHRRPTAPPPQRLNAPPPASSPLNFPTQRQRCSASSPAGNRFRLNSYPFTHKQTAQRTTGHCSEVPSRDRIVGEKICWWPAVGPFYCPTPSDR